MGAQPPSLSAGQILSSQSAGGMASSSGQPFQLNSNIGEDGVLAIGGDPMSFMKGSIEEAWKLDGPLGGDITQAIDQGSMSKAICGSPPENCMVKDSSGINVQPPSSAIADAANIRAGAFSPGQKG
ncbi:hypothetical protein OAP83_02685 [Rickettsiales bacterium]|nr:hypothetical protein [Rickettsiales bacterium]